MSQRIDKWLVYARFVKHRSDAQVMVEKGAVRLNRLRIGKTSQTVKPGDVLTLALPRGVQVVRVAGEPERRGPAAQARLLYEVIEAQAEKGDASPDAIC